MSGHTKAVKKKTGKGPKGMKDTAEPEPQAPEYSDDEVHDMLSFLEKLFMRMDPGVIPDRISDDCNDSLYDAMFNIDHSLKTYAERLEKFDHGIKLLRPFIQFMREDDARLADLESYVLRPARQAREPIFEKAEKEKNATAEEEIRRLVLTLEGQAQPGEEFEPKNEEMEKEMARLTIDGLLSAAHEVGELIEVFKAEPKIKAAHGHELEEVEKEALDIKALTSVLGVAEGFLELGDEELQEELQKKSAKGALGKATSVTELLAITMETVKSMIEVLGWIGAKLASLAGDAELAEACTEIMGETVAKSFGKLAGVVATIHGVIVMLDPDSSVADRIGGGIEAGGGVIAIASGEGGPGAALIFWYEELRAVTAFFEQLGDQLVLGSMARSWPHLADHMLGIARALDGMSAAGILAETSPDSGDKERYQHLVETHASAAGRVIDKVLDDLTINGGMALGYGEKDNLGSFRVMRAEWEPYLPLRGRREPQAVVEAAKIIMQKLSWCLTHAKELFEEEQSGSSSRAAAGRREEEAREVEEELGAD